MKRLLAFLVPLLAACSSEGTFEGGVILIERDAGLDAQEIDDAATPSCDDPTPEGAPCAADSDCKAVSDCELPRCNEATGTCIIEFAGKDGQPCTGPGGAGTCAQKLCCR